MTKQERLQEKFLEYREKRFFCDLKIVVGDETLLAHRLLVAKYSNVLKDLFETAKPVEVFSYTPDFNPQNMFISAINFMYTHTIEYTPDNIIAIVAISVRYDIPALLLPSEQYFQETIRPQNVLSYCQKCVEYNITNIGLTLTPIIIDNFEMFNRSTLFKSINAEILAQVLKDSKLDKYDTNTKLKMIDQFHEENPVFSHQDREFLASIVDWTQPYSYLYLSLHKCLWMPSKIIRPLFRKLMMAKRNIFKLFQEKSASLKQSETNRWYAFAWIQTIQDALELSSIKEVNAVSFIRSLGRAHPKMDPIKLGLIHVESSKCSFNKTNGPSKAINGNQNDFFESYEDKEVTPLFYRIDLGPLVHFKGKRLKLQCLCESKIEDKIHKLDSYKESLIKVSNEDRRNIYPPPVEVNVTLSDNSNVESKMFIYDQELDISNSKLFNTFMVKMVGDNYAGGRVFRIVDLDVTGEFLP